MKFYTNQHQFYCGIDLHAKKMYLCVLDSLGTIVLHRNMDATAGMLEQAIAPFAGTDLVIAVSAFFHGIGSPISVTNAKSPLSSAMPFT